MGNICEERIREALRHIKRAYDLVEPLGDLTADEAGKVVIAEEFRGLYDAVKEYGRCQFGVGVKRRGRG
jgi:hypothetical protein